MTDLGYSVLFSDPFLVVCDKGSGLLSVPGTEAWASDSAYARVRALYPEAQGGLERLDEIGQRVFELEQLELRCAGAQRARGGDAQANPIAGGWSRGQVEHEVSNVPHVRFGHL